MQTPACSMLGNSVPLDGRTLRPYSGSTTAFRPDAGVCSTTAMGRPDRSAVSLGKKRTDETITLCCSEGTPRAFSCTGTETPSDGVSLDGGRIYPGSNVVGSTSRLVRAFAGQLGGGSPVSLSIGRTVDSESPGWRSTKRWRRFNAKEGGSSKPTRRRTPGQSPPGSGRSTSSNARDFARSANSVGATSSSERRSRPSVPTDRRERDSVRGPNSSCIPFSELGSEGGSLVAFARSASDILLFA